MVRQLRLSVSVATVALFTLCGCSAHDTHPPRHAPVDSAASQAAVVVVPASAAHTDIISAYATLHRLGLRVALTRQTAVSSLVIPSARLSPRPGSRVRVGATVSITPGFAAIGSPAVLKSDPHYTVPNFVGRPLVAAVGWAQQHSMFWSIPKLKAFGARAAPHLFDGYRVLDQRPRSGATLSQGLLSRHGFTPTPLTLVVGLTRAG